MILIMKISFLHQEIKKIFGIFTKKYFIIEHFNDNNKCYLRQILLENYNSKKKYKDIDSLYNQNIPKYIFGNKRIVTKLKLIHGKYGNNKYFGDFINLIGDNIRKITKYNIDNLFSMFLSVYITKFKGFNEWGPGNNKNPELNLINHYNKHVLNSDENWEKYLDKFSPEAYGNFAINISRIMKNKMVHTNGRKVYLSGTYENILIIGRLDSENILGISSCYIIFDGKYERKIEIFKKNICFRLDS